MKKIDRTVPLGTFRRSRKISAPMLKLSKAVKSSFGIVPRSIHETLLGGFKPPDVAPGRSKNRVTKVVSPTICAFETTGSNELGFWSKLERKQMQRKEKLISAMKQRHLKMRQLLEMVGSPNQKNTKTENGNLIYSSVIYLQRWHNR